MMLRMTPQLKWIKQLPSKQLSPSSSLGGATINNINPRKKNETQEMDY